MAIASNTKPSLASGKATASTVNQLATPPAVATKPVVTFVNLAAATPAQITTWNATTASNNQLVSLLMGATQSQVNQLSAAQITALGNLVSNLSPAALAGLTGSAVAGITAAQIGALNPNQLAAIGHFDWLPAAAFAGLTAATIGVIRTGNPHALANWSWMSAAQIAALTPAAFAALTPAQIAQISNGNQGAGSGMGIQGITAAQIGALNPNQLAAIGHFDWLPAAAFAGLTAATIGVIRTGNPHALANWSWMSAAQIAALTPAAFAALTPAQIAQISNGNQGAGSGMGIQGITAAQIGALNPNQLAAIGHFDWLPAATKKRQLTQVKSADVASNPSASSGAAVSTTSRARGDIYDVLGHSQNAPMGYEMVNGHLEKKKIQPHAISWQGLSKAGGFPPPDGDYPSVVFIPGHRSKVHDVDYVPSQDEEDSNDAITMADLLAASAEQIRVWRSDAQGANKQLQQLMTEFTADQSVKLRKEQVEALDNLVTLLSAAAIRGMTIAGIAGMSATILMQASTAAGVAILMDALTQYQIQNLPTSTITGLTARALESTVVITGRSVLASLYNDQLGAISKSALGGLTLADLMQTSVLTPNGQSISVLQAMPWTNLAQLSQVLVGALTSAQLALTNLQETALASVSVRSVLQGLTSAQVQQINITAVHNLSSAQLMQINASGHQVWQDIILNPAQASYLPSAYQWQNLTSTQVTSLFANLAQAGTVAALNPTVLTVIPTASLVNGILGMSAVNASAFITGMGTAQLAQLNPNAVNGLITSAAAMANVFLNVGAAGSLNTSQFYALLGGSTNLGQLNARALGNTLSVSALQSLTTAQISQLTAEQLGQILVNPTLSKVIYNAGSGNGYWTVQQFQAVSSEAIAYMTQEQYLQFANGLSMFSQAQQNAMSTNVALLEIMITGQTNVWTQDQIAWIVQNIPEMIPLSGLPGGGSASSGARVPQEGQVNYANTLTSIQIEAAISWGGWSSLSEENRVALLENQGVPGVLTALGTLQLSDVLRNQYLSPRLTSRALTLAISNNANFVHAIAGLDARGVANLLNNEWLPRDILTVANHGEPQQMEALTHNINFNAALANLNRVALSRVLSSPGLTLTVNQIGIDNLMHNPNFGAALGELSANELNAHIIQNLLGALDQNSLVAILGNGNLMVNLTLNNLRALLVPINAYLEQIPAAQRNHFARLNPDQVNRLFTLFFNSNAPPAERSAALLALGRIVGSAPRMLANQTLRQIHVDILIDIAESFARTAVERNAALLALGRITGEVPAMLDGRVLTQPQVNSLLNLAADPTLEQNERAMAIAVLANIAGNAPAMLAGRVLTQPQVDSLLNLAADQTLEPFQRVAALGVLQYIAGNVPVMLTHEVRTQQQPILVHRRLTQPQVNNLLTLAVMAPTPDERAAALGVLGNITGNAPAMLAGRVLTQPQVNNLLNLAADPTLEQNERAMAIAVLANIADNAPAMLAGRVLTQPQVDSLLNLAADQTLEPDLRFAALATLSGIAQNAPAMLAGRVLDQPQVNSLLNLVADQAFEEGLTNQALRALSFIARNAPAMLANIQITTGFFALLNNSVELGEGLSALAQMGLIGGFDVDVLTHITLGNILSTTRLEGLAAALIANNHGDWINPSLQNINDFNLRALYTPIGGQSQLNNAAQLGDAGFAQMYQGIRAAQGGNYALSPAAFEAYAVTPEGAQYLNWLIARNFDTTVNVWDGVSANPTEMIPVVMPIMQATLEARVIQQGGARVGGLSGSGFSSTLLTVAGNNFWNQLLLNRPDIRGYMEGNWANVLSSWSASAVQALGLNALNEGGFIGLISSNAAARAQLSREIARGIALNPAIFNTYATTAAYFLNVLIDNDLDVTGGSSLPFAALTANSLGNLIDSIQNEQRHVLGDADAVQLAAIPFNLLSGLTPAQANRLPENFWQAVTATQLTAMFESATLGAAFFGNANTPNHISQANFNAINEIILAESVVAVPAIQAAILSSWAQLTAVQRDAIAAQGIAGFMPPQNDLALTGNPLTINQHIINGTRLLAESIANSNNASLMGSAQSAFTEVQELIITNYQGEVATGAIWDKESAVTVSAAGFTNTQMAQLSSVLSEYGAITGLSFQMVEAGGQINLGFANLATATTGSVGLTTITAANGQMQSAQIVLEEASHLNAIGNYAGTDASFNQVLLHEIGHALGLADNNLAGSIENYYLGSNNQVLSAADIAALQTLYGPSTDGLSAIDNLNPSAGLITVAGIHQLIQAMASAHTPVGAVTTSTGTFMSAPGTSNPLTLVSNAVH